MNPPPKSQPNPIVLTVAVAALFGVVALVARMAGWHLDFTNSAWGPIVAAVLTGVVGVFLKGYLDRSVTAAKADFDERLAAAQAQFAEKVEGVKAALSDQNNAAAARRAYEYEARKRLYEDAEPILFRLYEAIQEAYHRVLSLVRSERDGRLGASETSWLRVDEYYLESTLHKLLLPIAYLRLLQDRMTFVDFRLDATIDLRYTLLKAYVRSFTDDFDLAKQEPNMPYSPHDTASTGDHLSRTRAKQGLVVGTVEALAGLLTTAGDRARALSFTEFERLLASDPADEAVLEAVQLFVEFSPVTRPVFARIIIAQAWLGQLTLAAYHDQSLLKDPSVSLVTRLKEERVKLENVMRWSSGNHDLDAVEPYLIQVLTRAGRELAARAA